MARNQRVGRRLSERVAVVLESFAHLEDVAMPLGGEQTEPGALALQQGVGRDGGPVDDALRRSEQRGPVDSERCGEKLQPREHPDGR